MTTKFGQRSFVTWTTGLVERVQKAEKEIKMNKFRGKTKEGKQVYGCYLFDNSYGENRSTHLIFPFEKLAELTTMLYTPAEGEIKRFTGECYQVIPETVGQFVTKDKNGNDVFDGDEIKALAFNPPLSQTKGRVGWRDETLNWVLYHTPNTPECVALWKLHDIELMEQDNE